ncbi:hypothetical protein QBC40DRAFT_272669 [Triangularia verruculosa]|uniref:DUF1304 domain-containing protein n=1 Tax=Triangularia verruculosa TaxID=2587418 RepID=A0AAN7AYV2_9PEZI|nr:hypothetical protein QBC40DRAFT_272669 [Triangularia verruculosa]
MAIISNLLVLLVAIIHIYIFVLETFLWTHPAYGRKTFRTTAEFANQTKALAANQGLYNGFLAAGLIWGISHPVPEFASQLKLFFLGCVFVAGVFGGLTVSKRIVGVQCVPSALAALAVIYLG